MSRDYCECVECGHIHDGKVTAIEDIVNRLAAREKRMREVAAKVDSIADEMLAVAEKRTPRVLASFAYDLKAEAAKLLEGLGAE